MSVLFATSIEKNGSTLMLKVVAADVQERDGAKQLLTNMNQERHRVPRLTRIFSKHRPENLVPTRLTPRFVILSLAIEF